MNIRCAFRETYNHLLKFIENVRPAVAKSKEVNNVFLTWPGMPLKSSSVCQLMSSEMRYIGRNTPINSTLVRKSCVNVWLDNKGNASNLAGTMKHSLKQQQHTYDVRNTDRIAASTSRDLLSMVQQDQECVKKCRTSRVSPQPSTSSSSLSVKDLSRIISTSKLTNPVVMIEKLSPHLLKKYHVPIGRSGLVGC